jgi:hypothetical protein
MGIVALVSRAAVVLAFEHQLVIADDQEALRPRHDGEHGRRALEQCGVEPFCRRRRAVELHAASVMIMRIRTIDSWCVWGFRLSSRRGLTCTC